MPDLLPIHFAPLQGYTDAVYRQAHARIFGGIDTYYTPFVRVEHGEIRRKDIRELEAENNRNVPLVPQLIAPDTEKFPALGLAYEAIAKGGNMPLPIAPVGETLTVTKILADERNKRHLEDLGIALTEEE